MSGQALPELTDIGFQLWIVDESDFRLDPFRRFVPLFDFTFFSGQDGLGQSTDRIAGAPARKKEEQEEPRAPGAEFFLAGIHHTMLCICRDGLDHDIGSVSPQSRSNVRLGRRGKEDEC